MTHTESVLGLRSIWVDGVFKHDLVAEHKKILIKRKDVAYIYFLKEIIYHILKGYKVAGKGEQKIREIGKFEMKLAKNEVGKIETKCDEI